MSNPFNGDQLVYQTVQGQSGNFEMWPAFAPAVLTDITQITVHIVDITFTNTTSGPVTITVLDRQSLPVGGPPGTPDGNRNNNGNPLGPLPTIVNPNATQQMPFFMNYPIPPNQTIAFSFNGGRWMPGGVSIEASASNALVIWMRGYGPSH